MTLIENAITNLGNFFFEFKYVLLFYLAVAIVIYLNRRKFEIHGRVIALYRTKFGLKAIYNIGRKFSKLLRAFGYIGIPIGYAGMAVVTYSIFYGIYKSVVSPEAPPVVAPVFPGLPVPGTGIVLPLFKTLLVLFMVILIHEASHGIVARAHKIKVKNTGFGFFGPIPLAFVDPDENELKKSRKAVQLSVFAAGPWSNIVTGILVLLIMAYAIFPVIPILFEPIGITFQTISPGYPAENAGIKTDTVYTVVNGKQIKSQTEFQEMLHSLTINDTIYIGNEQEMHEVHPIPNPKNESMPYIGVNVATELKGSKTLFGTAFFWILSALNLFVIRSFGLGLANLLPLGPVDGGRMFQLLFQKLAGEEKGNVIWTKVTFVVFFVLIVLIFNAIFKSV